MTAPLPDPPTSASTRGTAGDIRRIDEPAAVPENLVIPPKPPLPVPETNAAQDVPEPGVPASVPADVIEPAAAPEIPDDPELAEDAGDAPEDIGDEPEDTGDEPEGIDDEPEDDDAPEDEPEGPDDQPEEAADAATQLLSASWESAAAGDQAGDEPALLLAGVTKRFGTALAVDDLSLRIEPGTFYGLVGPNGAGKTTTLSMIAGLLRPDAGEIRICGTDARAHEREAKRLIGVLPDRLRTFDRLTGRQLLTYAGLLRGLPGSVVEERVGSLSGSLDLDEALGRVVSDYSAGMTKKVMLAAAMIHAPRLLVLDEPFEALDPASSAVILDILRAYAAQGGTVVLSSHGMDLIERVCDRVAVLAAGQLLAEGTIDDVRGGGTLAERFIEIVGGAGEVEGLEWLHTSSD